MTQDVHDVDVPTPDQGLGRGWRICIQGVGAILVAAALLLSAPGAIDQRSQPDRLVLGPKALTRYIEQLIQRYAAQYEIDPALLKAVIRVESNFNPLAVSRKGALGLMQLMPGTAAALRVDDPMDPAQNIRAGTTQLRYLLDRFGDDIERALAAYHAGETRVSRFEGVPPIASTRRYVDRVLTVYDRLTSSRSR